MFTDDQAKTEWQALGVKSLPCAVQGDRRQTIMHVDQLRQFVGLPDTLSEVTYQEFAEALERVLEAVEETVQRVPTEKLGNPTPNRGRDLRELVYNIHDPVRSMAVALDSGVFVWETDHDFERSRQFTSNEGLARFCGEIRRSWLHRASQVDDEKAGLPVKTDRGILTHRHLLEAQAKHAAQHLRQIRLFLEQIGVEPPVELTPEELWPVYLGEELY